MPTTKQRRETARRRLERQLQRRQEAAVKRRRRNLVTAAAFGVVLVLGAVFLLVTQLGGDETDTPAAAPTPSASAPTAAREPKKTSGPCAYTETAQSLANQNAKDVGLPPDPAKTPATGTVPVTINTDRGSMTLVLDRAKAPCAVQSFLFLAGKKFFDNSPCHAGDRRGHLRLLQCGDPSGTAGGGPAYAFEEENVAKASYGPGRGGDGEQRLAGHQRQPVLHRLQGHQLDAGNLHGLRHDQQGPRRGRPRWRRAATTAATRPATASRSCRSRSRR